MTTTGQREPSSDFMGNSSKLSNIYPENSQRRIVAALADKSCSCGNKREMAGDCYLEGGKKKYRLRLLQNLPPTVRWLACRALHPRKGVRVMPGRAQHVDETVGAVRAVDNFGVDLLDGE